MISHILGKVIYRDDKKVILDRQGLGFEIFMSPRNLSELELNKEVDIYTFLFVGEKALELYGFLTPRELELFKTLKGVSGVGPKTAMSLAMAGSLENLRALLEKGEVPEGVKGVGVKKLQKILLDITGKIEEINKVSGGRKKDEAYAALANLGFPRQDIIEAIENIPPGTESLEERIKAALKYLGK